MANESDASSETQHSYSSGWLRAAVLGANDGIISTASLIVGVAAAQASHQNIVLTGVAGMVAGAMSMASGEYVSVSSQADTEKANLATERAELATAPESERAELAEIYVGRGLTPDLAAQVADQLMKHDALGAHARDELGITAMQTPRPVQAAMASACSFSIGAAMPLSMAFFFSAQRLVFIVSATSVVFLVLLGMVAARVGGGSLWKGALRVGFWGAFAFGVTAGIGSFFGTAL